MALAFESKTFLFVTARRDFLKNRKNAYKNWTSTNQIPGSVTEGYFKNIRTYVMLLLLAVLGVPGS